VLESYFSIEDWLLKPLLHRFVSISTPTLRPVIKFQKSIFALGYIVHALIRNAPKFPFSAALEKYNISFVAGEVGGFLF
jgi:hypothetical protein